MSNAIEVVSAAVIRADNGVRRMLVTQRAPSTSHSFTGVTPGGKVEPGESHALAVRREILEECGDDARVELTGHVVYVQHIVSVRTGEPVIVTCYECTPLHDSIFLPRDATIGVWWCDAELLRLMPMGPADSAMRETLVSMVTP